MIYNVVNVKKKWGFLNKIRNNEIIFIKNRQGEGLKSEQIISFDRKQSGRCHRQKRNYRLSSPRTLAFGIYIYLMPLMWWIFLLSLVLLLKSCPIHSTKWNTGVFESAGKNFSSLAKEKEGICCDLSGLRSLTCYCLY